MSNTPLNFSVITKALKKALESDNDTKEYTVVRSQTVNDDAANASNGWVGIYRSRLEYTPRTLGRNQRNFQADATLMIVVQAASWESGDDAEDRLEEMVGNVLSVLFKDLQVRSTLQTITSLNVTYSYVRTQESSMYFQEAYIEFVGATTT